MASEAPPGCAAQANILYWLALGLQPGPDDFMVNALIGEGGEGPLTFFIVCYCKKYSEEELELLRRETNTPGLQQDEFVGHSYLTVSWDEYDNIETLCNAVLRTRSLRLACKSQPSYQQGELFAWSTFEHKMVLANATSALEYGDLFKRPWVWATEEGRLFSDSLRQPGLDDNIKDSQNFWRRPEFRNDPCRFYAPGRGREKFLLMDQTTKTSP